MLHSMSSPADARWSGSRSWGLVSKTTGLEHGGVVRLGSLLGTCQWPTFSIAGTAAGANAFFPPRSMMRWMKT